MAAQTKKILHARSNLIDAQIQGITDSDLFFFGPSDHYAEAESPIGVGDRLVDAKKNEAEDFRKEASPFSRGQAPGTR